MVMNLVQPHAAMWPPELVELYDAQYRGLVRIAFSMLGRRDDAEEVVQEAIISLRGRWESVANPRAYLRRSVVNGSIAVIRRRQRAGMVAADPAPISQPVQLVELRDALLKLSERQRAVIVLRYVDGADDTEIAEALGVRRATVRSLAARGLADVRKELSDG